MEELLDVDNIDEHIDEEAVVDELAIVDDDDDIYNMQSSTHLRFRLQVASKMYKSFDSFLEELQKFEKESGTEWKAGRRDANPGNTALKYKRVSYVCRQEACRAKFTIGAVKHNSELKVRDSFDMAHNHPTVPRVLLTLALNHCRADRCSTQRGYDFTIRHTSQREGFFKYGCVEICHGRI